MAYAPPVSSLMTLNVLWSRSTPTTFPSPGSRMIGAAVSVSGRNLPIRSTSNPVARIPSEGRRLHAALADERRRFRRRHELHQLPRGVAFLRDGEHADGEIDIALQLRRQRTDVVGAGNRQDDIDLLHADLGFAFR